MVQNIPKHKIKDSVFTNLFQDKKYLLQLYKALHPEDSDITEDEIADITIKHVLIDGDYNDLGFSVGNRLMVLVESQSTWTYNIIIRALMYLVQTYHDYFKRANQNLYGSKKVNIPKPELYMIYTGDKKNIPNIIKNDTERNTAIKMIKKGKMSLEEIAEYVPSLSIEELRELEVEVLQLT